MTIEVNIGKVRVGRGRPVLIAGPCSVEPGYRELARATSAAGADILRGFVYKHRTSPDSFQGMGEAGLQLVFSARIETGLPVVVEVMSKEQLESVRGIADAVQVGSRNMNNVELLRAVGRCELPVILKRGMSATYAEWLGALAYIEAEGNHNVIMCERGIRTFETETRNTLDLAAVAHLHQVCDKPVLVDPSHAAGRRDLVPSLAAAGLGAGADGLEVEAHITPARALSDAAQTVSMEVLDDIHRLRECEHVRRNGGVTAAHADDGSTVLFSLAAPERAGG